MTLTKNIALLLISLFIAACSIGTNFVEPQKNKLVMGKTTKAQVIAIMGKPKGSKNKVMNNEKVDIIFYAFADLGSEAIHKNTTAAREETFMFHNDILVGKEYTSSFKKDSTYFDVDKAKTIKKGMKEADVIALLGKPSGEFHYPVISVKKDRAILYYFSEVKGFKAHTDLMEIVLNEEGTVLYTSFRKYDN